MDFIDKYTRAEAIADGVLTDVTKLAKEAGFKFPVALSAGVAAKVMAAVEAGKDYEGVVWDILSVLRANIRMNSKRTRIDFEVFIFDKTQCHDVSVLMYSLVGPGDDYKPVITISLPHED